MELLGIPAESLTLGGLLGVFVLFVFVGWLVPRRTLRDQQQETERWRTAFDNAEKARAEQAEQIRELAELGRTTNAMIAALPRRRADDLPAS